MQSVKLTGTFAVLLLLAEPVQAVDMCFYDVGKQPILVVKQWRSPSRGKCRSVAGYEASTNVAHPLLGTACLSAAGNELSATLSVPFGVRAGERYSESWSWKIPFPALGRGDGQSVKFSHSFPEAGFGASVVQAEPCNPAPIP